MEGLICRASLLFLTALGFTQGRTVIEKKYHWLTEDWGNCYVPQGCGDGTRERPVWCAERQTGKTALEYLCKISDQPLRTKPCFVACRHHKDHLEWRVGEWGPCLTSDNDVAGGVMDRNVTCILTSHDHVLVSMVIDDDNCLVLGKRPEPTRDCILPSRQECVLTEWSSWTPCCDLTQHRTRSVLVAPHYGAQPCPQLSEWRSCDDEDPSCQSSSSSTSTRLRVEKWGECRPAWPPPKSQGAGDLEDEEEPRLWDGDFQGHADNYYKHWPQVGTQHRTVTCLDPTGMQVDIRYHYGTNPFDRIIKGGRRECLSDRGEAGLPMRERACIISQDCAVSEWSEWSIIQEGCIDPNGNEWADITERRREVLRLHEGQGKSCPHLIETKETKANLPLCSHKYRWVTSKWSPCTLPGEMGLVVCGGGLQFRNITCVKAEGGQPLPPKQCQTLPPPPTVQRCEEACPRDCEVSQWAVWGPCKPHPDICSASSDDPPRPLPRRGIRARTRTVLVAPSAKGLGCSSLAEVQPCPHPRCFIWRPGPWSPCYLNTHLTKCGAGTRNRKVECVSHEGEPVPESYCTDMMPDVEEACLLPCPYDCVVSAWSSWSPCSQSCSTPTSLALRSRNRTIIAPPGHEGHPCPDPDEFMQIEGCNTHGCHGYSWMTLPWQDCNATCDREGYQGREVWCSENQEQVPDDKCLSLEKPAQYRRCTKECPSECQVSPWSEWSKCDLHTCYPNGTRGATTTQTRYRVVLEEGKDCGPLVEHTPCPVGPARPCPTYHWTTGNWSHCQLAKGVLCGHGLRTRDLWCTKDDGEERVELKNCLVTEEPLPVSVERCHADCHSPCQLTEWSNWSACKQPCQGVKDRTRQLIGLSWQHAACQALSLVETMPCPCAQYNLIPLSEWSSCLTNESTPCGTGTRYRAMACVDSKEQTVDPSLCGGSNGLQEEPCLLSCPTDCLLGDWTAWNECSAVCGPGIQNRTRQILREESDGGRPCSATIETKICNTSCDVYQWQTGGWSECSLLPSDRPLGCGTGDQYRQVRCIDKRASTRVDERMCDWTTLPADINGCHVACPGDCVLSPWSEWSICPKGCVLNSQQQRTRTMLRAAAITGANCPHAIQTQPCQLNVTCFTYRWVTTNYSSCLPLGGSPCGEGMATRAIYCLRSDNRPVPDSYCSDQQKPNPAEKWCYTDCPVDCELAEWSEWNSSKCHCDQTGMTRHAIIATNPSSSGRPCPEVLQWRPCPATPCYVWQPGNWSQCQLHGAACGHGVRTRNVTCVKLNDNTSVETWHCTGSSRRPSVWEPCHSPCESDCQLSPWSEWSHCHGDCTKDKSGYQTRSRAVIRPPQSAGAEPCPEALWETQPCSLGPCYTFDWTITSTGSIVCQRSDGLHVSGGCTGKKKPKTSACHWEEDRCVCEDGAVVLQQTACIPESNEVQARMYFPTDDDLNVWLFAMIGIGCVFIIFVGASIYLLCHSSREATMGYQQSK